MKEILWSMKLKIKHFIISIKESRKIHIGDRVNYNGEILFVNNGVCYPYWDLVPLEFDADGKRKSIRVHQKELKRKLSFSNLKYGLLFHYKFYMSNWYEIDLRDFQNSKEPTSNKVMGW